MSPPAAGRRPIPAAQDTSIKEVARILTFFVPATILPLLAYSMGAAMREAPWFLAVGLVVLIITRFFFVFGCLTFLVSIPIIGLRDGWIAIFLILTGMLIHLESLCNSEHTKRQSSYLLSGILDANSKYEFEEIDVPQELLKSFEVLQRKATNQSAWVRAANITGAAGIIGLSGASLEKPIRVFRYICKNPSELAGAAIAFPLLKYPSLIFVENSIADLNDAQRFQLYHELAHGSYDGLQINLRRLRWDLAHPLNRITMNPVIWGSIALACFQRSIGSDISVIAVIIASFLRFYADKLEADIAPGTAEAMADSIAMRHPDFLDNDKWKVRAQNLFMRLSDEKHSMKSTDPRFRQVSYRANWIKRCIQLGTPDPYHYTDVNPILLPIFILYVISGYFTPISNNMAYWGGIFMVILYVYTSNAVGKNSKESYYAIKNIDEKLQPRPSHGMFVAT
ncbi:hypothetical protein [Armatimonas rosea]|uniref:Uncharacterized protein n=1 Tax=Armatimonas rosea TaxID=685828 RepID=A0A7W9SW50_ARMRO|nr:hypothetical protein [Armatimonas rosea]MBB6053945.1 hypothetical protein [Armatimonas rosea]